MRASVCVASRVCVVVQMQRENQQLGSDRSSAIVAVNNRICQAFDFSTCSRGVHEADWQSVLKTHNIT